MGWFLWRKSAGNKKKSKSKRGKSTEPRWDPRRTLMAVKVVGSAAVAALLFAGWHFTQHGLARYAKTHHAQAVQPGDVLLRDAPRWMHAQVAGDLQATVAQHVGDDPVSNTTLRKAAAALERSAWVRELEQVRRLRGGRVEVRASYREPVAVIEARDGYHLVDQRGIRLPAFPRRAAVRGMNLPIVVGVHSAPPQQGQPWTGHDVQAGLALAQLVRGQSWEHQVRSVDVGRRDARGRIRLVLHTAAGQVRWGAPPGEGEPIEPSAQTKLERLEYVASKHNGQIDAGGQIVELYGATVQKFSPKLEGRGAMSNFTTSQR